MILKIFSVAVSFIAISCSASFKDDEGNIEVYEDSYTIKGTNSISELAALVSAGTLDLKSNQLELEMEELVLDSRSILSTEGKDVTLKIKRLVSSEGQISTFIDESIADGKNGGFIRILADSAQGKLTINLIGRKGRSGEKALEHKSKEQIAGVTNGIHGENGREAFRDKCISCQKQPTNGGNGSKGIVGYPGGNGGQGGSSGSGELIIQSPSQLILNVIHKPGLGGKGAPGGSGSDGGLPGIAGQIIRIDGFFGNTLKFVCHNPSNPYIDPCKPAIDGLKGERGDFGPNGIDGLPGEKGEFCIRKQNNENECF